ncbi:hypothetical protein CPC16_001397 [Podila verticillata]|nr:hypothetical protein CPC16_001397 [Podila verticillata]
MSATQEPAASNRNTPPTPEVPSLSVSVPLPTDRSTDFIQNLMRAANGSVGLQDRPLNTNTPNANTATSHLAITMDNRRTSPVSSLSSSSSSSTSAPLASIQKENQPLPPLPGDVHNMAPRRSLQDIGHQYHASEKPLPPQPQGAPRPYSSTYSSPPEPAMEHLSLSPSSPPGSSSFFMGGQEQPRTSLDQPPPYSFTAGSRGSAIIASAPPTEENLFQIQELARPPAGSSSSQQQLICANPMHDQQYLLVGSGCALHSIDLTLPSDKQTIRTHIQGVAFREIHCLEDIGLVVVVAGRNSNVRCYDYDSIKRLVTYGHSKEGKGRVVEGGKLGPVKNMIQLRVETAALKDDTQSSEPVTSPTGQSRMSRILKGASSNTPPRHHHTTSIDRSLLSPPVQSESSPWSTDATDSDSSVKKHKQRPLSFGGLASMAQEHVSKSKQSPPQQQQSSTSTPASPSTGSSTKNKRFSQMASYLSQAAVNSNVMAHMTNGDAPSEEAVACAWDFTKLKQPRDVLGLDFHYTPSTVFMTVLSKTGIDIFSRPKSARGRKAAPWSAVPSNPGSVPPSTSGGSQGTNGTHGEAPPRISINTGGMATASSQHHHRDNGGANPYEWKPYKQFYHPEAPGFMTVVKDSHEVTDIILGKGTRACVVSVDDMSVTDLHRQETSSVMHGISKKLGFRNNSLWHSFEKIPFDVPAHILYPAAATAIYGRNDPPRDIKESGQRGHSRSSSDIEGRSRDDIMQRSSDQRSLHQQEQDELEEAETQALAVKLRLQEQYPPNSSSSSSSNAPYQAHPVSTPLLVNSTPSGSSTPKKAKARMVTSDEVLNMAFSRQTTSQLFLATYGSQSRIVDIQGKPQSRVVLDWESFPPQKVEFLKTASDIYVVGFEKTSIVVFSLTRAKKVKEILKKDLLQAAGSSSSSPPGRPSTEAPSYAYTPSSSPNSSSSSSSNNMSINIKFLGRDNIAEDSLGIFFSYCHPRNGVSICKLCILSLVHDDLELLGYYP